MAGVHATFSPSAIHRWVPCPGSIKAGQGLPDKPTVYAAEGTVAHGLVETALRKKCFNVREVAAVGDVLAADGFEIKVSDEMLDATQAHLDIVRDLIKESPEAIWEVERRFSLSPVIPEISGTADFILYEEFDEAVLLDCKHGRGHLVQAKDNPQLMAYALGAALELNLNSVCIGVVQPRVHSFSKDFFTTYRYTIKDLIEWAISTLRPAITLASSKNPPRRAGDHCEWCRAKLQCPELKSAVISAFDDFQPGDELDEEPKAPDAQALTAAQLGEIHAKAPMIRDFLDAVETRLKEGLAQGVVKSADCGYKLVQGRKSPRRWCDKDEALTTAESLFPGEKIVKREILSPAALEKVIGPLPKELLARVVQTQGLALVKADDKRQEVMSLQGQFDTLEIE